MPGEAVTTAMGSSATRGVPNVCRFDLNDDSVESTACKPHGEQTNKVTISRYREKSAVNGGGGGIRTLDTVSRIHTFQACAFSHSATPPEHIRSRASTQTQPVPSGALYRQHGHNASHNLWVFSTEAQHSVDDALIAPSYIVQNWKTTASRS